MHGSNTDILRHLLRDRTVAALATLHAGRPAVSMVPFAAHVAGDRLRLVIHVSGLAAHTHDMREMPAVSLLVTAAESPGMMPQALPRVSLAAVAEFVPPDHPDHAALRAAYLARFPEAEGLFALGDFSIVALEPTGGRLVAGFARALNVSPAELAAAVSGS